MVNTAMQGGIGDFIFFVGPIRFDMVPGSNPQPPSLSVATITGPLSWLSAVLVIDCR